MFFSTFLNFGFFPVCNKKNTLQPTTTNTLLLLLPHLPVGLGNTLELAVRLRRLINTSDI